MTRLDYAEDGLHLVERGQRKRMQVAYRRLVAGTEVEGTETR